MPCESKRYRCLHFESTVNPSPRGFFTVYHDRIGRNALLADGIEGREVHIDKNVDGGYGIRTSGIFQEEIA